MGLEYPSNKKMITFTIFLNLVSLTFAHQPLFVCKDESVVLDNEPSKAVYACGNTDFFIFYNVGDTMHTSVLIPYTHGYYGEKINPPILNYNCSFNGNQTDDAPRVGEVLDEPFAMGSYIYTHVLFWGHVHEGGYCTLSITSDSVYVVSIGKEEELAWLSMPNTIMSVSAWNNNYVYGWVFLIGITFLIMATVVFGGSWEYVVIWSLTCTILNRLLQLQPFGWARPSLGILFILFQLTAAGLSLGTRSYPRFFSFLILLLIILPFYTWVDRIVLIILVVLRIRNAWLEKSDCELQDKKPFKEDSYELKVYSFNS